MGRDVSMSWHTLDGKQIYIHDNTTISVGIGCWARSFPLCIWKWDIGNGCGVGNGASETSFRSRSCVCGAAGQKRSAN